jgi:hypothetical protein
MIAQHLLRTLVTLFGVVDTGLHVGLGRMRLHVHICIMLRV